MAIWGAGERALVLAGCAGVTGSSLRSAAFGCGGESGGSLLLILQLMWRKGREGVLGLPPPRCVLLGVEALRGSDVVQRHAGTSRSTALVQDPQHSTVYPRPCSLGRPSTSSTGWPRTPSGLGSQQPHGLWAALEALILPHSPGTPCYTAQPCPDVREQRADPEHPAVIAPPAMPRAGHFPTPSPL